MGVEPEDGALRESSLVSKTDIMNDTSSPYLAPQSGMSAPPVETPSAVTTSIPKVFGIIHIVYACIGMVGAIFGVGVFLLMETVLTKTGGEIQEMDAFLEAYSTMAIYTYIDAGIKIMLGVCLLVAGIGLLKRRLWAQKVSILWAVVRVVVAIVMTVVTYGASIEFQERMAEVTQSQQGQIEQSQFQANIQNLSSVFSVIMVCIYPVLTIIFLSKKVVKDSLQ